MSEPIVHPISIRWTADGMGTKVAIGDLDITPSVLEATVILSADGIPQVELILETFEVTSITEGTQVVIGPYTATALERLGWTPPAVTE